MVLDRRNSILYYSDTLRKSIRSYSLPDKKDRVVFANLQNPTDIRYIPREKFVVFLF
jgi:hypothetical protein